MNAAEETRDRIFDAMIAARLARIEILAKRVAREGGLRGRSTSDRGYSLLLSRNTSDECPWRVTNFRDGVPMGHRTYPALTGVGPCQDALAEFMSRDMEVMP